MDNDIKIITNNHSHELVNFWDLKDKDREWYEDMFDGIEDEHFFYYRGNCHLLSDYMRIESNSPLAKYGYDAYSSDSFFSGTMIKLVENNEYVKVATYIG